MPCLNEDETLRKCIRDAKYYLSKYKIKGEIIIADNGSTDRSVQIAKEEKVRVVVEKKKGYGSTLLNGIHHAKNDWIVMCDSDASYDFSTINIFYKKLQKGSDLVMGNRFEGGIERGAMPWSHRYIGNPFLSRFGRLLFTTPVRDFHCGIRAFHRRAILKMKLQSRNMLFASEMVMKASILGLQTEEIPVRLHHDGRKKHRSYLHTWRDGWANVILTLQLFAAKAQS